MLELNIEEAEEEVEREFIDTNGDGERSDRTVPIAQGRANLTTTHV